MLCLTETSKVLNRLTKTAGNSEGQNKNGSKKNATAGREIVPNTGANAPKFFTLATKS